MTGFPVGGAAVGAGDAPPLSWRGGGGRRSGGAWRRPGGGGTFDFQQRQRQNILTRGCLRTQYSAMFRPFQYG